MWIKALYPPLNRVVNLGQRYTKKRIYPCMADLQQLTLSHETPDHHILTRGIYSATPWYFLDTPVTTAAGQQWRVSQSLRELGAYVNYQPSPEGIRDYLCYGFVPAPRTVFQGVSAVPPGMTCRLPLKQGQAYWQMAGIGPDPLPEQPEQLFWQQLCHHTKLDQATVLLSGGLDSAMVAAAATAMGTHVTAYHARFRGQDDKPGSDTHAARLTARHLGLEAREIVVDSLDALRWFTTVIGALDQPLGDPVLLPFYLLFKAIRQHQHTVLTGEGGDQLFGSWAMKPMIMRELYPTAGYCRDEGYVASFHKFNDEWPLLLSEKLRTGLNPDANLASPVQQAFATSPSADFCNQIRWVDLQLKGLQHIMPRIAAMATAHKLDIQHPFFAADMIRLGMALPNHLKFTGVKDKVLLKILASPRLPEAVVERRKLGMGVPTSLWFRHGLWPLASYYLNKQSVAKSGLLDPETVQAIRRQELGASDGRGRRWGDRLWMLCVLEYWFASLQK